MSLQQSSLQLHVTKRLPLTIPGLCAMMGPYCESNMPNGKENPYSGDLPFFAQFPSPLASET